MDSRTIPSETHRYSVPDVSCEHCRAAIVDQVSGVENVDAVEVDLDAKMVTVSGAVDDTTVITAIREAGYSTETV